MHAVSVKKYVNCSQSESTYEMTGNNGAVSLNSIECEKDLGVYVDTELNFQSHED